MKISKVLKVLGAAAAVAALTPYQVEKDEETGVTTLKALLWGAKYTPGIEGTGRDVDVTFGLNIPGQESEAELFADDEPEAAVPDPEDVPVTADMEAAVEEAPVTADEADSVSEF